MLDEWAQLTHPTEPPAEPPLDRPPPPVTANRRAFNVLVRNALFQRVEWAARRQWHELGELDGDDGWDGERWFAALAPYFDEHGAIGIDADARSPALLVVDEQGDRWAVRQILDDPAGDHDWGISAEVDLGASDAAGTAAVRITAVDRL